MLLRIYFTLFLLFLFNSCSKDKVEIYKPTEEINPYVIYDEAYEAFKKREFFYAEKKFSQAELQFTDVDFAAKSAIMSSFCFYSINFYDQAIDNLNRYIKTYPADKNIIYAHYLIAIIYFEKITDEKKDLDPLLKADAQIDFFINKYPDSDYAIDLKFKKDLIRNQLAAKELFVAKYYISIQKWASAIKRLKNIVNDYNTTIFIEEALHRLVEIHYHIGLEDEAKNYAKILGYNYNTSEWFEQSYKILNKDYKIQKKEKIEDKDENLLKRVIKKII